MTQTRGRQTHVSSMCVERRRFITRQEPRCPAARCCRCGRPPQIPDGRGDPMLRPEVLRLCLVALCVACQPQSKGDNVERARTYAEDKAVVWDGILRFLQANDITVVGADLTTGVIHAERTAYQDAGWADCERARVIDRTSDSSRPRRARPISRDLELEVATTGERRRRRGAAGRAVHGATERSVAQPAVHLTLPLHGRARARAARLAWRHAAAGIPAAPKASE
jgi:hypothetical protein